jgi:hypothetical protein
MVLSKDNQALQKAFTKRVEQNGYTKSASILAHKVKNYDIFKEIVEGAGIPTGAVDDLQRSGDLTSSLPAIQAKGDVSAWPTSNAKLDFYNPALKRVLEDPPERSALQKVGDAISDVFSPPPATPTHVTEPDVNVTQTVTEPSLNPTDPPVAAPAPAPSPAPAASAPAPAAPLSDLVPNAPTTKAKGQKVRSRSQFVELMEQTEQTEQTEEPGQDGGDLELEEQGQPSMFNIPAKHKATIAAHAKREKRERQEHQEREEGFERERQQDKRDRERAEKIAQARKDAPPTPFLRGRKRRFDFGSDPTITGYAMGALGQLGVNAVLGSAAAALGALYGPGVGAMAAGLGQQLSTAISAGTTDVGMVAGAKAVTAVTSKITMSKTPIELQTEAVRGSQNAGGLGTVTNTPQAVVDVFAGAGVQAQDQTAMMQQDYQNAFQYAIQPFAVGADLPA